MLVNGGQELVVYGSYSYTGPDNKSYHVEYVADRNGFRPHLTVVDDVDQDAEEEEEDPPISTAGFNPESEIRRNVLKSLLG